MPVVRCPTGKTYVYSSDFSWPLEQYPVGVDILVVDATYGDPSCIRNHSTDDAISALIDVVRDELRRGTVLFTGHRGRLQAAAQILLSEFDVPAIFSKHAFKTLSVFEKYRGFKCNAFEFGSAEAAKLLKSRSRCFVFAQPRDRREIHQLQADRRVFLSPFVVPRERPVAIYDALIRVALTDHADFEGTVGLIRSIAPKFVIADGSKGGNAKRLSEFVREELRIPATAETREVSNAWGMG